MIFTIFPHSMRHTIWNFDWLVQEKLKRVDLKGSFFFFFLFFSFFFGWNAMNNQKTFLQANKMTFFLICYDLLWQMSCNESSENLLEIVFMPNTFQHRRKWTRKQSFVPINLTTCFILLISMANFASFFFFFFFFSYWPLYTLIHSLPPVEN